MNTKNKIVLGLSILHFIAVLVAILKSFDTIIFFGIKIEPVWLLIWCFTLFLPVINFTAIINNRESWNKYYWIGLLFNILSIVFIIRHYKIDLF